MPFPVLSTYRLQMRGDCFTFADAENLLDYLDELGVSHLYLSPILTAVDGSTHGYDVTDPTTVSEALGGRDGLARLSTAARARGIGLVVDLVPNHVGVDPPDQNRWWWDVLNTAATHRTHSTSTSTGRWTTAGSCCRCWVPTTTSTTWWSTMVLRLGELVLPIAPGTGDGTGPQVHDRQHYRLIGWRRGLCGYRRFFSITSLAGLRQEDRAVFDATHAEVKRWFTEDVVEGVRIDHPDGLSGPARYLAWLREAVGPDAWIAIEKILAVDEALELSLPVDGTTGYDALREIGGLFIDPAGRQALTDLVDTTGDDYHAMPELARRLKAEAVTDTLASELGRLCRVIVGGCRHRPPGSARRGCRAGQPHRGLSIRLSGAVLCAADRTGRDRGRETGTGRTACGHRCRARAEHGGRGSDAAVVRRGDREVDGGLLVLPRRPAGVAQRGRR